MIIRLVNGHVEVDPPLDSFYVTKKEDNSLVQGDAHQAQHRGTLYNVNDDGFDNSYSNVDPVEPCWYCPPIAAILLTSHVK